MKSRAVVTTIAYGSGDMGSGYCDSSQPLCNGGSHLTSLERVWLLPACTEQRINTVRDTLAIQVDTSRKKNTSYYFWASKNIQWVHVPAFYMRQVLRLSAIGAASPQIV